MMVGDKHCPPYTIGSCRSGLLSALVGSRAKSRSKLGGNVEREPCPVVQFILSSLVIANELPGSYSFHSLAGETSLFVPLTNSTIYVVICTSHLNLFPHPLPAFIFFTYFYMLESHIFAPNSLRVPNSFFFFLLPHTPAKKQHIIIADSLSRLNFIGHISILIFFPYEW